jgi:hypothetical protein
MHGIIITHYFLHVTCTTLLILHSIRSLLTICYIYNTIQTHNNYCLLSDRPSTPLIRVMQNYLSLLQIITNLNVEIVITDFYWPVNES